MLKTVLIILTKKWKISDIFQIFYEVFSKYFVSQNFKGPFFEKTNKVSRAHK